MKNDNKTLKISTKQFKEQLCNEFCQKTNIASLAKQLSIFIDQLLIDLFSRNSLDKEEHFCLVAIGSYGRRELLLHSDVDLLLLHSEQITQLELNQAQQFIRDCWDIGLEVSHQITTVQSFGELAAQDLTVISSAMDMHLLCGKGHLFEELRYLLHTLNMWPSSEYFFAKCQEQKNRYIKYAETEYNLEPNVKNGPGGLRDIQTLVSISKRHFSINHLAEGIGYGFITEKEYEELMFCQHFLWRVRFALHKLAGKAEERLSFDYQIKLAQLLDYKDNHHSLAIEQFMKDYFKVTKRNRELNEMLLQWFDETIVYHEKQKITHLDNNFQLSNQYIEVKTPRTFIQHPISLLTLFLWIAKRPEIEGVRASTIRLIRQSLYLINNRMTSSYEATNTFMSIIKEAQDPYEALQKMSSYGVLAHYIHSFAMVTGQMQYDLYHAYTVDQHTLFVIRNISRFRQKEYAEQFPLCAKIINTLEKPEILYLSALFHDIAKGRGGDHSELGATEALEFAKRHHLDENSTNLLVWLVRHHLMMSTTTQRQDIYDPEIIRNFCQLLPQPVYLDYLYLLTVADICGTNPSLWNSWKDSLLKELYHASIHMLQEKQSQINEAVLLNQKKQDALKILSSEGISFDHVESLWKQFKSRYFLHESPEVIAIHTKAILKTATFPLILILPHHTQGGTEVFIYMPHEDERFTITTSVLSNRHVTIQEASITTCNNQYDLDTYIILDEKNKPIYDAQRLEELKEVLKFHLTTKKIPAISRKRIPRVLAHFTVSTEIYFTENKTPHTHLLLITGDRPGLLARISRVFLSLKIHLHNAKIATVGERAEDMFYITNAKNQLLDSEEKNNLKQLLIKELSRVY